MKVVWTPEPTPPTDPDPMDTTTRVLEHMTWPEVEQALAQGCTTVVVPCGAVEQHGPHLPLFMDAEHGTWLGAAVARRLGNAFLAPTIRVGCSEHHMAFPGSLTLRRSTFDAVCQDYCTSLARHGFTRICMLPTHGGNFGPLAQALPRLNAAVQGSARVLAYTDLLGMLDLWKQAVSEAGAPDDNVGGHADVAESSIMMVMHPELVRSDRAAEGYRPEHTAEAFAEILEQGFRSVTPNGVLGDPRGMSREAGERCIARVADAVAAAFAE